MSKLTFAALRSANASRAPRWHTSEKGMNEWTIGDWFMAMAGETGECADELLPLMFMSFVGKLGALGNISKKYRRVQEGIANRSADPDRLVDDEKKFISKAFEELADIQIYLDLFALRLREALHTDEDIGDHVEKKFNKTSVLYDFPERLIDGQFMLASKGKFKMDDYEWEGEVYQNPETSKTECGSITIESDEIDPTNIHLAFIGGTPDRRIGEVFRKGTVKTTYVDSSLLASLGGCNKETPTFGETVKLHTHDGETKELVHNRRVTFDRRIKYRPKLGSSEKDRRVLNDRRNSGLNHAYVIVADGQHVATVTAHSEVIGETATQFIMGIAEGKIIQSVPHIRSELKDRMTIQSGEFNAVADLAKAYDLLCNVPIVDDDYPMYRNRYEGRMMELLRRLKDNGRTLPPWK